MPATNRFLYGTDADATRTPFIAEFDYRWKLITDDLFQCEPNVRDTTKRLIPDHLSVDGEAADWVLDPKGSIKKANLTFTSKFLWLIVRHYLSPTCVDIIVTWDRAVLMASMVEGFEVDFSWLLQAVVHERDFKVTTTYTFPCMVFELCRSVGVLVWHIDVIKTLPDTMDIFLIRDEDNELYPHGDPHLKV